MGCSEYGKRIWLQQSISSPPFENFAGCRNLGDIYDFGDLLQNFSAGISPEPDDPAVKTGYRNGSSGMSIFELFNKLPSRHSCCRKLLDDNPFHRISQNQNKLPVQSLF
jgi:hypothetical protein